MARASGVPAVVGLRGLTDKLSEGDELLIDGFEGVAIINPSESKRCFLGREKMKAACLVLHLDPHPKPRRIERCQLRAFLRKMHAAPIDLPDRVLALNDFQIRAAKYGAEERARSLRAALVSKARGEAHAANVCGGRWHRRGLFL